MREKPARITPAGFFYGESPLEPAAWIETPSPVVGILNRASGDADYMIDLPDQVPQRSYFTINVADYGIPANATRLVIRVSVSMTPQGDKKSNSKVGIQARADTEIPPSQFGNGAERRNGTLWRTRTKGTGLRDSSEISVPVINGKVHIAWFGEYIKHSTTGRKGMGFHDNSRYDNGSYCSFDIFLKLLEYTRPGDPQ